MKKTLLKLKNERGQFLILLAVTAVLLLLIIGVAIDAGRLYLQWSGLTRALDAACTGTIRQVQAMDDAGIETLVNEIASYNMQQQGANIANLLVETDVQRHDLFAGLVKLNIAGTLSNYPTLLMKLIPGQNFTNIRATTMCPICYDNPNCFKVGDPATGDGDSYYEGGLLCQQVCNGDADTAAAPTTYSIPNTTQSCCPYVHGWQPGDLQSTCTCVASSALATNTDSCDPNSGAAQGYTPQDPGISAPVWIARPQENDLTDACILECTNRGFATGNLWCNEGCSNPDDGNPNDPVCCKCHCSAACEGCV